jgi:membrane associated rhomboid family serine protease
MVPAPVGHHCPTCVQEAKGDMKRIKNVRFNFGTAGGTGVVVKGLIAVNALVFLLQQSDKSIVPRFVDAATCVGAGQNYRLLTSAFLHANLTHIVLNMLGLWIIGSPVEHAMGRVRFLALYLVAGIGGSVAFNVFGGGGSALGASGAVFGLFGAAFVLARSRGGDPRPIVILIVINLLFGAAVPGIDNWGHLGGLATGFVIAVGYELAERFPGSTRIAVQVASVVVTLALLSTLVKTSTPAPTDRDRLICQIISQPQ